MYQRLALINPFVPVCARYNAMLLNTEMKHPFALVGIAAHGKGGTLALWLVEVIQQQATVAR